MKGAPHVTWRCCVCSNLEPNGRGRWHVTSVPTWWLVRVDRLRDKGRHRTDEAKSFTARAEKHVDSGWNEKCDRLDRRVPAMRWLSLFLLLGGVQAWFFCRD